MDFHSHAQFVEWFQLSDAEIEPDYVFDDTGLSGSCDHNATGDDGEGRDDAYPEDAEDFNLDQSYGASPTLSSVLQMVSNDLPEDIDAEDFSWEAEDPDNEDEELDHLGGDQSGDTVGKGDIGNPVRSDVLCQCPDVD